MTDLVEDVARAAQMMDAAKPSWWRRIVFRRLDMASPCNCIAGQAGLDWEELHADYMERYPLAEIAPFADGNAAPAWINEVRERRAAK